MLKLIHTAMIPGLPSPDKNEKAECEKSRQAGMLAHHRVRLQNMWIAVDVGRTRWCWVESGLSENMAEWKVFLPIKVLWRVGWDGCRCWQRSGAGDKGHKSRSRTPTKLDNLDNVNRAENHIIANFSTSGQMRSIWQWFSIFWGRWWWSFMVVVLVVGKALGA